MISYQNKNTIERCRLSWTNVKEEEALLGNKSSSEVSTLAE